MNEALKMQISAFVDGELPDNESELLLRRLSQDAAMRQQVAEYLEVGRLMRLEREVPGMGKLRGRISAALGDEALPEPAGQEVVGSGLMTPTTGIAVAATVAAVALVALSQISDPLDPNVQQAVAIDPAPMYTVPPANQVLVVPPTGRQREMLRLHGGSSPDLGSDDILTRMASFEISEDEWVKVDPDPHLVSGDNESNLEDQVSSE